MADGIKFDKTSYKTGDLATVTVTQAGRTITDTLNFATAAGTLTSTTKLVADATKDSLTHSAAGEVKLVSDDGVTAVYTVQY